jgi:hypothetical protein
MYTHMMLESRDSGVLRLEYLPISAHSLKPRAEGCVNASVACTCVTTLLWLCSLLLCLQPPPSALDTNECVTEDAGAYFSCSMIRFTVEARDCAPMSSAVPAPAPHCSAERERLLSTVLIA